MKSLSDYSDQEYVVSEWAFYNRKQKDIGREFKVSETTICNLISDFLVYHRPDLKRDRGWGYAFGRAMVERGARKQLARTVLAFPRARREPDLGDLWLE